MATEKQNILNSLTWFYKFLGQYDIDYLQDIARMVITNRFSTPITTDDGEVIVDDDGYTIFADWRYKEV